MLNLVAVLTRKSEQCAQDPIEKTVGGVLYELQRLGDSERVRQLVSVKSPETDQCWVEPDDEELDMAMYAGLLIQMLGPGKR